MCSMLPIRDALAPPAAPIDPMRHVPLVLSIVKTLFRGLLPVEDLVQEGMVGLLYACKNYNPHRVDRDGRPARSARFGWYARRKIRWAMLNALEKHFREKATACDPEAMAQLSEHHSVRYPRKTRNIRKVQETSRPECFSFDTELMMSVLSPREQRIIDLWTGRYGDGALNLVQIARQEGVSKQRAYQLWFRAIRKMRAVAGERSRGGAADGSR